MLYKKLDHLSFVSFCDINTSFMQLGDTIVLIEIQESFMLIRAHGVDEALELFDVGASHGFEWIIK